MIRFDSSSVRAKSQWLPLLCYVSDLHRRSTRPPEWRLPGPWEEIGPGYRPIGFGHWDIVHAALDALVEAPGHARQQIRNLLALQLDDGLIPSPIYFRPGEEPWVNTKHSHPALWTIAVDDWVALTGDASFVEECFEPLVRLIDWFENHRRTANGGFFYEDICSNHWESGIDEGVRFDDRLARPAACVDATAHLYNLYRTATDWARLTARDPARWQEEADQLRAFIQTRLYDSSRGFFYDAWRVSQSRAPGAFEGFWPVVVGAATPEQAARVVEEHLMNPRRFFTPHPISTLAREDPRFELRMWRGPVWNSMTYWAARGCLRYGHRESACRILEHALDQSARVFAETGTIWEFYHPDGGDPRQLTRKPGTDRAIPCRDYLGHNPLIAMAELWERCVAGAG